MKSLPFRPLPRRFRPTGLLLAALLAGGACLPAAETVEAADGTKVTAPVSLKRVLPVHPLEMQKELVNGYALVECVITETGAVESVKVVSATRPEFGHAAEEALRQWEFKPGEAGGRPVSVRLQIPFEFKLTMEQLLESALKRPVFREITDLIIPAQQLPSWPRPVEYLLPRYPKALNGSGKYGKAVVSVVINKEGKVMNPTILKSTYPEFILPALATAARLQFPPQVMANGERIYVSMDIQFDFKDDSGSKPAAKDPAKEPPKKKS